MLHKKHHHRGVFVFCEYSIVLFVFIMRRCFLSFLLVFELICASAQTPYDEWHPETYRPILNLDSIQAF